MRQEKQKKRDYHQIMSKLYQKENKNYHASISLVVPVSVPVKLSERAVSPKSFQEVSGLLQLEGMNAKDASETSYHAVKLLRSTDRVLQYLQKWGKPQTQALSHLLQKTPNIADKKLDLKTWGDAVLQQGPRMMEQLGKDTVSYQPRRRYPHGAYSIIETAAACRQNVNKSQPYVDAFGAAQSNAHQKYLLDPRVGFKQGLPLKP